MSLKGATMALVFSLHQRPWQKTIKFRFLQGLETMIDEYESMDKPMASQKEMQEGLDLEQVIPPPPYEDVEEEVQEGDDEDKSKSLYNVPYMRTVYSPRVGKRGGAMDRIMKREGEEIWEKRGFGAQSPWTGQASDSLPRGKKSSNRDWTRISKRGRETEGSWHPYKRDPIYR